MISGSAPRRAALVVFVAAGILFLYFFGLTRTGLVGPDEPRYAAIGRAMAATGDWVTPRLWGAPWFEKPALLYWMTAIGFKLGLGPEAAARAPVALASVAFLIYFFVVLRREFGGRAAWYATAMLATSAGWLAYSHIGITDLPMSAALAAAMLTVFGAASTRNFAAAGVLLGLAVLAKGLVPLVLFAPALVFLYRRVRDLALLLLAAALAAAPWYVLVSLRNATFLNEFIWKHHFGRFLNSALQHGQPWWFFVPVLAAGLFPWTPVLAVTASTKFFRDCRTLFLLAWFAWGFVFFSISRNKLPGYLLPLLPPVAALMGIALEKTSRARYWLAACGALFFLAPPLVEALPQALLSGISHTPFHLGVAAIIEAIGLAVICGAGRRWWGLVAVSTLATLTVVWVVWHVYPQLDRELSGRNASTSMTCLPQTNRSQRYSIDFYVGRNLPDCK